MSDRFVVPAPSEKALAAANTGRDAPYSDPDIRAAYAVDVPAIVRNELERLREDLWPFTRGPDGEHERARHEAAHQVDKWIRSRFPEAVPERCEANLCAKDDDDEEFCLLPNGHPGDHRFESVHGPTTPPERREPCACGGVITDIGCIHTPERCFDRQAFHSITPAERDFLRVAAKWVLEGNQFNTLLVGAHPLVTAARRVVKEAK